MSEIVASRASNVGKRRGCLNGFFPEVMAILLILACSGLLAFGVIYGCSRVEGLPSAPVPAPSRDTSPPDTAAGHTPEAAPPDDPAPEDPPAEASPDTGGYKFGTALGERERVDDSWFDGAVFLGDSRTEGLQLFSGLYHGNFFWHRGMNVFRADDEKYAYFDVDGEKTTLLGTLRAKKYKAVYLMLGINELGYPEEEYAAALAELVDKIIVAQPEAVIFLQTMPPVNDEKAGEYGVSPYVNTENVDKFNLTIAGIALEKRVVLLDTAGVYRGPDGQLPEELTGDGVHFTSSGYKRWADFLRTHTMEPEEFLDLREKEG